MKTQTDAARGNHAVAGPKGNNEGGLITSSLVFEPSKLPSEHNYFHSGPTTAAANLAGVKCVTKIEMKRPFHARVADI